MSTSEYFQFKAQYDDINVVVIWQSEFNVSMLVGVSRQEIICDLV